MGFHTPPRSAARFCRTGAQKSGAQFPVPHPVSSPSVLTPCPRLAAPSPPPPFPLLSDAQSPGPPFLLGTVLPDCFQFLVPACVISEAKMLPELLSRPWVFCSGRPEGSCWVISSDKEGGPFALACVGPLVKPALQQSSLGTISQRSALLSCFFCSD